MTILLALSVILISGFLWRLRGIMGWPFTVAFAVLNAWTINDAVLGPLFAFWIVLGEPTGWKPKLIWDKGDWWPAAILGARIGGIGAVAVPLSTWLNDKLPEPRVSWLQNTHWFKLPFWSDKKQLLNWRGAWNEVYFGVIFSGILQGVILLTYGGVYGGY